jgi:hypothetical protein
MALSTTRRGLLAQSLALTAALAWGVSAAQMGHAASDFNARLDLELKVVTPVITNKFGFATSFPRPALPPRPAPAGPNPMSRWTSESANGGTVFSVPNPLVAQRKSVPAGRGMLLHVGGHTDALPVNGSYAVGEGWASGRTRIRLGNFTGRPGLPAAEDLKIDLGLTAFRELLADASNDPNILDWASAKYSYEVTNATTGEVLVSRGMGGEDFEADPAYVVAPGNDANPIGAITLPAGEFHNIELFGHVYAAGSSEGFNPLPALVAPAAITKAQDRFIEPLPDPAMEMAPLVTSLLGDAWGHGAWQLASVAGVTGEDPFAHQGLDTLMIGQAVTSGNGVQDLEIAVEVPLNGFSQIAIEDVLAAAGGFHGFFHGLQIGVGTGERFQMSQDPLMMSFAGPQSQLPPQEFTGAFQLAGANDPFQATQLAFQGMLQPRQRAEFLLSANLHDAADGVLDAMARFTIRQVMEGFGGDYTGDFVVDEQDQHLWASVYGTPDVLADGNANGMSDGSDFLLWQRHSGGNGAPPVLAATAVPEPATGVLWIGMGSTIAGLWRRCR